MLPTPSSAARVARPAACAWLLVLLAPGAAAAWWQPKASEGRTFDYMLGKTGTPATINRGVCFLDGELTTKATVDAIHAAGAKAVCYFSAGSWEDYRTDAASFPAAVLGKVLDGWPNEKWLDIRSLAIRPIMKKRMAACAAKGFDGVDPDNVDGWDGNDTGFPLTAADQITYNKWLASTAHNLSLACGLKNDVNQIGSLVGSFDFFVNEQCMQYLECNLYGPAKTANKPVFNVEYTTTGFNKACRCQAKFGLMTIKANLKLTTSTKCDPAIVNVNCPVAR